MTTRLVHQPGVCGTATRYLRPILDANNKQVPRDPAALAQYQLGLVEVLNLVKLVIWDLDDTFWQGVLLENTMRYSQRNHELVVGLSRRGIINSVCSHNEVDRALAALREHGILDHFVLPQIGYGSKGLMVKELIAAAQLRPANVLFVDDHPRQRADVTDTNPGVLALSPEELAPLDLTLIGESDPDLDRLRQYKVLESKLHDQRASGLTNEDFLRTSEIVVTEATDVGAHAERILELVNRTNQLNFTKQRLTDAQLQALLASPDHHVACYHVKDRFGDYGICGFVANHVAGHRLDQFVFSCRILGMGVEQYVYHQLDQPTLHVEGDVASTVHRTMKPDWIRWRRGDAIGAGEEHVDASYDAAVLVKGGCDLESTVGYLRSSPRGRWRVRAELHKVSTAGRLVVWPEHTDVIRLALESQHSGRPVPDDIQRVPWFDDECWATTIASPENDVVVLSLLQDYGCGTYAAIDGTAIIPCEYFGLDITRPESRGPLFSVGAGRSQGLGLTPELLDWFCSRFRFVGPISEERLADNLRVIVSSLPDHATLLVINGAEIEPPEQAYPFDDRQVERHREMNAAVDRIVANEPRMRLIDVRLWVTTSADLGDRLFHYKRHVYSRIAESVASYLAGSRRPEMDDQQRMTEIRAFIVERFLDGDDWGLEETTPLLQTGIIDSLGIIELVAFLRERFQVSLPEAEFRADKFETLSAIATAIRVASGR